MLRIIFMILGFTIGGIFALLVLVVIIYSVFGSKIPLVYWKTPRRPLQSHKVKMLSTGLILSQANKEYVDDLLTHVKILKPRRENLESWWGINDAETALETLEWLKHEGQRLLYAPILNDLTQMDKTWNLNTDFTWLFKRYGGSFLLESHKEDYSQWELYVSALEIHPELLESRNGYELYRQFLEEKGIELGDFGAFTVVLRRRFSMFMNTCDLLKEGMELLKKEGVIQSEADLQEMDTLAWDMGRLVNVARWSYRWGYIDEGTAWAYIEHAYEQSRATYATWADFAKGFMLGRIMWESDRNQDHRGLFSLIKNYLKDKKSPWVLYPLGKET
ncbi:MAG: DUF1266 domain-containing protein [Turicibacter sp.]|nr:DUF1266 domain-containing protein [Turicibacter sp.]